MILELDLELSILGIPYPIDAILTGRHDERTVRGECDVPDPASALAEVPLAFAARNAPDRDIAPRGRGDELLTGRIEAQRGDVVAGDLQTFPRRRVVHADVRF